MKCIHAARLLFVFFFAANATRVLAQGGALQASKDAAEKLKQATVVRKNFTDRAAPAANAELVQIGRAVFYLNQMNAMEKRDCAKYIKEYFVFAKNATSANKTATASFQKGGSLYIDGAFLLLGLNPLAATEKFVSAHFEGINAIGDWNTAIFETISMANRVQKLKDTIDAAIVME